MKKILALVLVLAVCSIGNAMVSFELNGPITATAGQTITLNVVSDAPLFALDAITTIASGTGTIAGAMNADAATFGWDMVNYPDTAIISATSAEFGGTQFNLNSATIVGYVKVLYNGGTVTVNLTGGYGLNAAMTMDGNTNEIKYSDSVDITAIPEPITMALLGLGGLFLRRKK